MDILKIHTLPKFDIVVVLQGSTCMEQSFSQSLL